MYQRRTININRVVKLLQGAGRSGASIPDLLDQCDIPRQLLDDPDGTIERDTFIKMMLLIMQQTQDEFLGFGQGRKSKPGTFSMMAHAVINCPTLGAAIERGIRFYDLFELSMHSRIERHGDIARLVVKADPRLDFREVIIETSLFVWLRFMSWLVGKAIEPQLVKLDYTDVRNDEEHRFLFDCPIEYSADENAVSFRADFLDLPLVQNELSLSKFLKDSLAQLFDGNIHNVGLPAQIRAI
ncbi:AraC family transcriptional regulator, partial [Alcanivorax sp. UBA3183]